jgi:Co/Zn/Cd efflux system component
MPARFGDQRGTPRCDPVSRHDVAGNLAVLLAASGAFATGTAWPDLAVAMLMSISYPTATAQVVRHALEEFRSDRAVLRAK